MFKEQVMATPKTDRVAQQLAAVAHLDDARIRIETVAAWIGWSRSRIYAAVQRGEFPQPIRHGARCSRWKASDIKTFLATQETSA